MSTINTWAPISGLDVKEAIYISPLTGGTTRIQIKEFRAKFSIHIEKSKYGDFYPTTFKIMAVSEVGYEYPLEQLELIDPNQEQSEFWAELSKSIEKIHRKMDK